MKRQKLAFSLWLLAVGTWAQTGNVTPEQGSPSRSLWRTDSLQEVVVTGTAKPWSDIDVAVILPNLKDEDWLELSANLWHDVDKVSLLIEPVLMSEEEETMLYRDVMRTGIAA